VRRQRRLAGSHLQAGQRDGTSVWRGAAGKEKTQPRGKVVRFLGGSPQSRGPRVRVIAPEKEVMIGGASLHSMEGFGGGEFVELSTARGGQASAEDRIAVNQCSRSHVSPGKGGWPGSSQEADSSDFGASFREEARFFGGHISVFEPQVLGGPCGGSHRIHMHARASQFLIQCN
jgi:hypothetical protein